MILLYIIRWSVWLFVVALLCSIVPDNWFAMFCILFSLTGCFQFWKACRRDY